MTSESNVRVILQDEENASGMANMVAGLLVENLGGFRSRSFATRLIKGDVTLKAKDRDYAVVLTFDRGLVTVRDAVDVPEPIIDRSPVMEGEWLNMAKVVSGRSSPIKAFREKNISLSLGSSKSKNLITVLGTGFVLSVPKSFYELTQISEIDSENSIREFRNQNLISRKTLKVTGVVLLVIIGSYVYKKYRR